MTVENRKKDRKDRVNSVIAGQREKLRNQERMLTELIDANYAMRDAFDLLRDRAREYANEYSASQKDVSALLGLSSAQARLVFAKRVMHLVAVYRAGEDLR